MGAAKAQAEALTKVAARAKAEVIAVKWKAEVIETKARVAAEKAEDLAVSARHARAEADQAAT